MTKFAQKVYQITKTIPRGKVAAYGQIAKMLGNKKAARAVGNALHKNPNAPIIPCHRVVSSKGYLASSFGDGGLVIQLKRLKDEGIIIKKKRVDLKKYQHKFS